MKRKHKKFSFPRKMFDKARIIEENKLKETYGLKNKREIWKADAKVKYYRNRAKLLLEATPEEQQKFFENLNALGLTVETVTDVLALHLEDILKRRLSSIMVAKKIANTPKHARQMIVHKKVMVDGRVVNVPSYLVPVAEETTITIRQKAKPLPEPKADPSQSAQEAEAVVEEVKEEIQEEVKEDIPTTPETKTDDAKEAAAEKVAEEVVEEVKEEIQEAAETKEKAE